MSNKTSVTPKGLRLEHHKINGFKYLTCPNQHKSNVIPHVQGGVPYFTVK